jgi:hypothetical protein
LLALQPRPDAVFCFNDPAAIGAMEAILDAGLRIPEDIALVGCGNLTWSGYLRVPLTSVDQSSYKLGEEAAKLALTLSKAKKETNPRLKSILITPKLVMRQSSAPRAASGRAIVFRLRTQEERGQRKPSRWLSLNPGYCFVAIPSMMVNQSLPSGDIPNLKV